MCIETIGRFMFFLNKKIREKKKTMNKSVRVEERNSQQHKEPLTAWLTRAHACLFSPIQGK